MKKYLKYILHAVILIGLGVAAAKYLNGEEVLSALRTFNYGLAPLILALSAVYIFSKGWRFAVLMRPLSRLSGGIITKGYVAGTAATLLPGGVAARAGLMSQAGVPVEKSGAPVAYSSILDQAVFVFGLLGAALWFEAARVPALVIMIILTLLGLVFLVPFLRTRVAHLAEWIAEKLKVLNQWRTFLSSMGEVSTARILLVSLAITFAGVVLQVVILDLCLRGFGLSVPYPTLFLAYILPTILGRNSALPAGVGVTEAGMVGVLATAGQVDADTGAAAAAIFRAATVLFHALLGALVYFFAWKGEHEGKAAPGTSGPAAAFRKSPKGDIEG